MNRSFPIFISYFYIFIISFHGHIREEKWTFFFSYSRLLQSFAKLLLSFSSFVFSWSLDAAAFVDLLPFCQLLLLCDVSQSLSFFFGQFEQKNMVFIKRYLRGALQKTLKLFNIKKSIKCVDFKIYYLAKKKLIRPTKWRNKKKLK